MQVLSVATRAEGDRATVMYRIQDGPRGSGIVAVVEWVAGGLPLVPPPPRAGCVLATSDAGRAALSRAAGAAPATIDRTWTVDEVHADYACLVSSEGPRV